MEHEDFKLPSYEEFKKLSMQLEEAQECCDILNMEIKEIVENEIKLIQSKYNAVSSTENKE